MPLSTPLIVFVFGFFQSYFVYHGQNAQVKTKLTLLSLKYGSLVSHLEFGCNVFQASRSRFPSLKANFLPKFLHFSSPFSVFTEEEETGLAKHNEFREVHTAPPMTLDAGMCDEAKAYAKKLAQMGTLMHSTSSEGENLSMGCSTNKAQTIEEAVTNW